MSIRSSLALAALVVLSSLGPVSPAVADPASGTPVDGIPCDQMEGTNFHIHQHLAIYDHGRPVAIPDDIGRPVTANCFYWIHTHTSDGLIHIESSQIRDFTLGELFDIWGEPLSATHVVDAKIRPGQLHAFVGGHPYAGDPRKIALTSHADIVLEAGGPYHRPASFTNWDGN